MLEDFKEYFDREFEYGPDDVRDKDVVRAIEMAETIYNPGIYPDEPTREKALLYLSAHFLQLNLDGSDAGGQADGIMQSRSADGISESRAIPQWMLEGDNAFYATTIYGQRWLAITLPYTVGQFHVVRGGTLP